MQALTTRGVTESKATDDCDIESSNA